MKRFVRILFCIFVIAVGVIACWRVYAITQIPYDKSKWILAQSNREQFYGCYRGSMVDDIKRRLKTGQTEDAITSLLGQPHHILAHSYPSRPKSIGDKFDHCLVYELGHCSSELKWDNLYICLNSESRLQSIVVVSSQL